MVSAERMSEVTYRLTEGVSTLTFGKAHLLLAINRTSVAEEIYTSY